MDCIRNGRMMIDKVINDEQLRRNQQAQNNARGDFADISERRSSYLHPK